MANGDTPKPGTLGVLREQAPLLLVVLAMLGVNVGYTNVQTVDRFTGSQGAVLKERLNSFERRLEKLPPENLLSSIAELKVEMRAMSATLHQLEVTVGRLEERLAAEQRRSARDVGGT